MRVLIAIAFMIIAISGTGIAATPSAVHPLCPKGECPSKSIVGACWYGTKPAYCGVKTYGTCLARHARDLVAFNQLQDCHGMSLKPKAH